MLLTARKFRLFALSRDTLDASHLAPICFAVRNLFGRSGKDKPTQEDALDCEHVNVPKSHVFDPKKYGHGFNGLAQKHKLRTYKDFYQFSLEHNDIFWGTLARHYLQWQKPFHTVQSYDFARGKVAWFLGGKLNVSENCVDRHASATPDKVALIYEKDEPGSGERVTYKELLERTCKLANVLKSVGVKKGDPVCIYLSSSTLAAVSMLACARIGAVHCVTFAGLSAESLRDRINDCRAKVVITADVFHRGGKTVQLKKIVDQAIQGCPSVKTVCVEQRVSHQDPKLTKNELDLNKALDKADKKCKPEVMDSEDPLYILYTSGSTGKPKGLVHTHAGYLLYAAVTHQVCFDYQSEDVFGCVADVGWVTGHTYGVYGPLANGGTTLLFESTPTYPDPSRYWEMVERLKINQLYCSPTALRSLMKHGDDFVKGRNLSSLKTLGVVGEPINHEAWEWLYDVVGNRKCPIVDTYWQTEAGGVVIAPLPADRDDLFRPSMSMRPFFGIEPVVQNTEDLVDHGADLAGSLCFARPWPGIARGIYGDDKRFEEAYFSQQPGTYFAGDGCVMTQEGHIRITGDCSGQLRRSSDDVINTSGHRLGTAEVEDALNSHSAVAESAVVGFPDSVKGEVLAAFVVPRDGKNFDSKSPIIDEMRAIVKTKIASYAVPKEILICEGLPTTRSGKILRRMLKKVANNEKEDFGDQSTLSDSDVLTKIVKLWASTESAKQAQLRK